MKKIALLLFIAAVQLSCDVNCCTVISADVSFSFENSKGEDLLNPNTLGALTEENVDVYVLKNGVKTRLYQGNLDAAKFFKIRAENGKRRFIMYFDIVPENFNGNKITQFIRYKDGTEDEIVGEFNADRKRNKLLQTVWINGIAKTKIETASSGQTPFLIVK